MAAKKAVTKRKRRKKTMMKLGTFQDIWPWLRIGLAVIGLYYGLSGQIGDLKGQIAHQSDLQAKEVELQAERFKNLELAAQDTKRNLELQRYELQEVKLALATAGLYKKGTPQ
jgi:hypothetical protein